MQINRRTLTIIASALLILAVGAMIFAAVSDALEKKSVEDNETALEIELIESGLVSRRVALQSELRAFDKLDEGRLATATFLFREPNVAIYESIRPNMSLFGMTGIICLSPSELPGDEGNVSKYQFDFLLKEGYSTAVIYDGSLPLDEYLTATAEALSEMSIAMPEVLYVYGVTDSGAYYLTDYDEEGQPAFTETLDATLEKFGIAFVIQETYATKAVCYENFYEPFRYTESLGFLATYRNKGLAAASLNDVLAERGSVVYSVGFDFGDFHSYYGTYDHALKNDDGTTSDNFMQMLNFISQHRKNILITGMRGVYDYRTEYNMDIPDISTIEVRRAELEAELATVEAEIAAIKAKYYR